jgi:TolA-binding protein
LAEVRFLKGIALQQDLKYEEARGVFLSVRDEFPEAKITPESDFQQAYCLVLTEDFPGAATEFERVYKEKKNPEMTALALYWQGNVLSMGKQFPKSKEVLQRYLKEFPKGESYTDAVYRVAYCTHSLGDYKASAAEMADYLKRFPQGLDRAEAQVLQGEAYLALGEVDKGIEILKAMPKTDPIMYAEAYFKVAKALKINKRDEELREHMARFEKEMPGSNRLAEALNWQGGSYRSEPEKAREIYLGAIRRLGNDSAQWSLTEVFRSLSKLYRGDKEAYVAQLRALRGEAQAGKRDTLLLYTYWAEADAVRKTAPERSQAALLEAAPFLKVQADNPEVMADIADALRVAGRTPEAETLYRDLRKWNPRAMQRDRAFMALAEMARDRGETEEARKWFARLEREVPNSPLVPGAQLALARMLSAEFRFKEAAAKLEPVLTRRGVQPRIKAQSMLLLADNSLSDNKVEAAIPYYEKIYLLYGRFAPEAAQAFLGHGKALEKQGKEKEAAGVYRDMLERAEVATLPAAQEARERMRKLPAPAPKEEVVNPS